MAVIPSVWNIILMPLGSFLSTSQTPTQSLSQPQFLREEPLKWEAYYLKDTYHAGNQLLIEC